MKFKKGDAVIHKSDRKSRKMVVVDIAVEEFPPSNKHNELVNVKQVPDGSYYCTWIAGAQKGESYFTENELEFQDS